MAKKNLKVDIDTDKVDIHVERKDGEVKVNYDSKNLDVKVEKTADNVEVKVDAQSGFFKLVGKILSKVLLRRIK
jgi:predicted RNA-binding protein Jag